MCPSSVTEQPDLTTVESSSASTAHTKPAVDLKVPPPTISQQDWDDMSSADRLAAYAQFEASQEEVDPDDEMELSKDLLSGYTLKEVYLRIYDFLKPYKWQALAAVLLTIPVGAMDGVMAWALKPYMDGIQGEGEMLDVNLIPFFILGFAVVQGLLNYAATYLNGWVGFQMMNDIRFAMLQNLNAMEMRRLELKTSGWVLNSYYRMPERLQLTLLTNTKQILTRLFSAIFLSGVLLMMSWQLALIAITVMVIMMYPVARVRKLITESTGELNMVMARLLSYYTENFHGIRVIVGFNLGAKRAKQYQKMLGLWFNQAMRRVKALAWLTPIMHIISALGIAVVIGLGTQMVTTGDLTSGSFTAFLVALVMLYNPIKGMGNSFISLQMSLVVASRVFKLLDVPSKTQDIENAYPLTEFKNQIRFEKVWFNYSGAPDYALFNVELTINKGEMVALVGPSGSGKSTLTKLIPRFYEPRGKLFIDEHLVHEYRLADLRNMVSLVLQDTVLFEGTLADNLRIGKPDATPEELWNVLELAQLADFVRELPEQLNTRLGENGNQFSGGQRQRIAIARAFLKDAPIVILDEATSALDNESEAKVQQAMDALMADRTVIVVAHRLSTIRHADRIVVLDQGQVVEEGTHDELVAKDGLYAHLLRQSEFEGELDVDESESLAQTKTETTSVT